MKGSEEQLLEFMDGHDKRFLIPVYQRNYDWKIPNCRQLYDDLVRVIRSDRKSHFFGSIVYVYDSDSDSSKHEYLIIDGQQRLTTISLLLLAMYNLLEKGILTSNFPARAEEIYNEYLIDKYAPEETRIKLKPVKNDDAAFHKLFEQSEDYYKNSNLTINFQYFYNRIQKEEISIDELYKAIKRLQIISIRLNGDDNPQLIFESLNSTGLDLTEGDKIRNFVLMGQPREKQTAFYETYWNPIEKATNYEVSLFVRDYLSVKTQLTPSMKNVYEDFKSYANKSDVGVEELLKELLLYAKNYEILLRGESSYPSLDSRLDVDLRDTIRRLNWLETTVTRPFLLEVLRLFNEERLTIDDLHSIFHIVENYVFRRNLCDVATNALNKIFLNLNREIIRYDGTCDQYVEKLKYALLAKKESGRFPDDEEFLAVLSEKNVYNMRNKYRTYILERYENFGTLETKNIYAGVEKGMYTIEHIMPQHLTPGWMEELGEDYQRVHSTWLHRLANLTLTAYNSKFSNEPFVVKKTLVDKDSGVGIGFENSGLRMNQWIAKRDHWTEAELIERDQYLLEMAKKIWSYVQTDYKPAEKPVDTVTLGENVNLTGRLLSGFSYRGAEQPVTSWVDAYVKILRILHQQDASVLTNLAYTEDSHVEMSAHVSADPNLFRWSREVADGIYVWTGISTQYKITNLLKFFKLFNVDPGELTFYLKEANASPKIAEGGRFALRKRYWEFALPIIQEENRESGCFDQVHPTTSNWISGSFGIGGFSINCIANRDGARVEFDLNKSDVKENKAAFDLLYLHQEEVGKVLGDQIKWERADEFRYSCVCACLSNVSISNEADWKLMAKFHAAWSRKLCEALLPYLKEKYKK